MDDIELKEGICQNKEFFKCTFENGICGFNNDLAANFNWNRASGRVYNNTGPSVDHTVSYFIRIIFLLIKFDYFKITFF